MSLFDLQENPDQDRQLLRILAYGEQKTRKTWWSALAANAGFNVVLLDSDYGYHILKSQIKGEAAKRIQIFPIRDTLKEPLAIDFMTDFLKFKRCAIDTRAQRIVKSAEPSPTIMELRLEHLDHNTVLILDSYTALVESIIYKYAKNNHIDQTDPTKTEWTGYAWTGGLANYIIEKIRALPCHVIMIAHKTMYEKRKEVKEGAKVKQVVEYTREQIKSTSGPHAMLIGSKFTDILNFEVIKGGNVIINTEKDLHKEGGARVIPPGTYKWADLTFSKVCEYAGVLLPPKDLPFNDYNIKQKSIAKAKAKATQDMQDKTKLSSSNVKKASVNILGKK